MLHNKRDTMNFVTDKFDILLTDCIDWNDQYTFFSVSLFILILCLIFWFVLHQCIYYLVSTPIISIIKKYKSNNLFQGEQAKKFHVSVWKMINYSLLAMVGLVVIWSGAFEYPSLEREGNAWIYDYETYYIPLSRIPLIMVLHYQLAISSYIYGTYTLVFVEHRMKDFWQMMMHHIITLCLTVGSYYIEHSPRSGCVIMVIHDLCDPLLELAKCFNYIKWKGSANVTFVAFATAFIAFRCFIYPLYVVLPVFTADSVNITVNVHIYGYLLMSILILNLIWATLIVRMMFRQILTGHVGGDIRED